MCQRSEQAALVIITPVRWFSPLSPREIWRYRDLIRLQVTKGFRVRYSQTIFGGFWSLIHPVMQMIVFSILFGLFSRMPSDGVAYPVFLFVGMVPWVLFSRATSGIMTSLHGSIGLCSKVYFPRVIFPIAQLLSAAPDFFASLVVLFAMMAYFGIFPSWQLLLLVPLVLLTSAISLGVGLAFAALSIHFRDVREVMGHLLNFWFYCTPVVYPRSAMPPHWRRFLSINPLAEIIEAMRAAFLGGPVPSLSDWARMSAVAVTILVAGLALFQHLESSLIDVG